MFLEVDMAIFRVLGWTNPMGRHPISNLGSLHVLGGRYGDFQSVGLDKPNGLPPYTGCRSEVDPLGSPKTPSLAWRPIKFFGHRPSNLGSLHDPLGSPKTPSLAWRPIKFFGHRPSNLGSLHVLGGRYGDFQSVGLDKPNGSPPYTGCRSEVDPLGSPKTPSLAWRPIKLFRPPALESGFSTCSWRSIWRFSECWAGQT